MLKNIQNQLGLFYSYFQFHSSIEPIANFTKSFSFAKNALVILPFIQEEFNASIKFTGSLHKKFPRRALTFVYSDILPQNDIFTNSNLFQLTKDKINFLQLTKPASISNLLHEKFDVVIDLNRTLVLPAAYLTRLSHADFKISFSKKHGDLFYNFQFNVANTLPLDIQYQNFFNTISMF